jgi:transcriptional enhancer factor
MSSTSAYHPSRPMLSTHHSDYHHPQQQPQHQHTQPPLDHRRSFHGIIDSNRLPLRDTASNGQQSYHSSVVSCYPPTGILSPSSMPPSSSHNALTLPPPPSQHAPPSILPSQSFDCLQRIQRPPPPPLQRFGHVQPRGKPRAGINPLYFWPQFRQYRNRQAHKDTQKDKGGVWRRNELEDAFVDCKSCSVCTMCYL